MKSVWLMLALGVTLTGMSSANARNDMPAKAPTDTKMTDDPYLWLEDIHGDKPMEWVKAQNALTAKRFMESQSAAERSAIFHDNAIRFYRLPPKR